MKRAKRIIGLVRDWPRHPAARQTKAVEAAGASVVYSIPDECKNWRDAVRFVRNGDGVAIELIQLLPEPRSDKVLHPAMDGRDAIEEIERRGGYVIETETKRTTADPKQRAALIADMARSVGAGGRSLSSEQARANSAKVVRKRGRRPKEITDEQWRVAHMLWHSRKISTWDDVAAQLPKPVTVWDCFKRWGGRAGDPPAKKKRK